LISLSPVKIVGADKLHVHETAVYASNHLSYMDTPVLFARLPFQFRIREARPLKVPSSVGIQSPGQVPADSNSPCSLIAASNRGVAVSNKASARSSFLKAAAPRLVSSRP
jgi:1-acyl-sn-glycerol-3-phosphate acyltransferase